MKKREVIFQHGAMRAIHTNEEGIAAVSFRGLVTPVSICAQVHKAPELIRRLFGPAKPRMLLVRLDRATVYLGEETLNALFDELGPASPLRVPASVLVRPDSFQAFHAHGERLTSLGVPRGVFTEPSQAMAWASARRAPA